MSSLERFNIANKLDFKKGHQLKISTKCAICGTLDNSKVIYKSTIDESAFSVEVFSARRLPDRRHYQWVSCNKCALFRSDPIEDIDLFRLYKESTFDYSSELHGLSNSYRKLLIKTKLDFKGKSLLELGGGNGFFLEEAISLGFTQLTEIEPSESARNSARPDLRKYFIMDMLKPGLVENNTQDVVAAFHVMDHLSDPSSALKILLDYLKPDGKILIAVHNVHSISATLLKNKSPIFDVEHTYLYSKKTLATLLASVGFKNIKIKHYKNSYSLAYIIHLLPIPNSLKISILSYKKNENLLRKIRVKVPLGNIYAIATKPSQ